MDILYKNSTTFNQIYYYRRYFFHTRCRLVFCKKRNALIRNPRYWETSKDWSLCRWSNWSVLSVSSVPRDRRWCLSSSLAPFYLHCLHSLGRSRALWFLSYWRLSCSSSFCRKTWIKNSSPLPPSCSSWKPKTFHYFGPSYSPSSCFFITTHDSNDCPQSHR